MDTPQQFEPDVLAWRHHCLRRLHRLMELTPEAAPPALSALEAFALIEWCRMVVYDDCHEVGAGGVARVLVRRARRAAMVNQPARD